MKLTKESLKKIIKEELEAVMDEGFMSLGPEDMGVAYDFTPEQAGLLKAIAAKLNRLSPSGQSMHLPRTTFQLKNNHPLFKGFKGDEMAIQTGLQKYGYKGRTRSTFAISENNIIEEGRMTMAYYNQSMIGVQVELQYDGKSVDFQYRYAGKYANNIQKAIQSLANKRGMTIGSKPGLAEGILEHLQRTFKGASGLPTLEQLKSMPVIFG